MGYKISKNPRNGESFQDKLGWAITIQNVQTDLGLQRSAFPDLGIQGDYVFTYNLSKQMELEDLDNESWLKEYKKKRRAHIQEIVDTSFLSQEEKEWLHEVFMNSHPTFQQTFDPISRRYVERVTMV